MDDRLTVDATREATRRSRSDQGALGPSGRRDLHESSDAVTETSKRSVLLGATHGDRRALAFTSSRPKPRLEQIAALAPKLTLPTPAFAPSIAIEPVRNQRVRSRRNEIGKRSRQPAPEEISPIEADAAELDPL